MDLRFTSAPSARIRVVKTQSYLFHDSDLAAVIAEHDRRLTSEIDAIDADEFLGRSPDDLASEFVAGFTMEVPRLHRDPDDVTMAHRETKVDVSQDPRRAIYDRSRPAYIDGTEYAFHVPFEGDPALFRCTPSTRLVSGPPLGAVRNHELVLTFEQLEHDADELKASLGRDLDRIEQYLQWVRDDVRAFNDRLPEIARQRIDARRERLLADRGIAASLGYRMRVRLDAPRTYAVPSRRRKPPVEHRKPAAVEPFKPEPELPEKEYEHILDILSRMVNTIERSPEAFRHMKEEHLRDQFLVQLNGHYEGSATGETFNFDGKTDILVREQGRSIFIAECKFWRGPKTLTDTIDQLLGYLTWRDTKAAILLFNRTKNLSAVLAKVPEVMEAHGNYKRPVAIEGETRFRFIFAHRDDPDRELTITVLVFEVPA
jgi:hypothetical protein